MGLLITYDLRGKDRDYKRIEGELERLQARHVLKSVWVYDGPMDPELMLDHLLPLMDRNTDGLYVAPICGAVASNKLL